MRHVLAILLGVLVLGATGHAFSLHFDPEGTTNVPTLGSRDIIITVSSDIPETVALNMIDSRTWTTLSNKLVRVESGKPKDVILSISPFEGTATNLTYRVTLTAESLGTQQMIRKDFFIFVYKGEVIDIEKIEVSGEPKPTGSLSVKVYTKNYKTVPSNEVTIRAVVSSPTGPIFEFTDPIENINPGEAIISERTFWLAKHAPAGLYKVVATLTAGATRQEATSVFEVSAKAVAVTTEERQPLLFGFSKTFAVTNDGNQPATTVTLTHPISAFEGIFFMGDMPTTIGDGMYTWTVTNVAPGELRTVSFRIDYMPLFLFLAAIAVVSWAIFFKLRTIRIKKYIIQKKELQEGEEFTVGIEAKNATGRRSDELTVRDILPPIFELKDTQAPHPVRKKTPLGTELTWTLHNLHPREERVMSYKMVPLFGVHGEIRLPRATVTFKQNRRTIENKSLFARIGITTDKESNKPKKRR